MNKIIKYNEESLNVIGNKVRKYRERGEEPIYM